MLIVAVFVAGIGEGPQLAALFAVRHREAPEHLRGQIFTTGASLKITGFALGGRRLPDRSRPGPFQAFLALAASVAVLAAVAYFAIPSEAANPSEGRSMPSQEREPIWQPLD
ncbi:hypothetical protein GCM10020000_79050 [Streptomyces olivoverticillatus]